MAVLTNAGGLGILCADAQEAVGLGATAPGPEATVRADRAPPPSEASLANPVDMLGSASDACTRRCCRSCSPTRVSTR